MQTREEAAADAEPEPAGALERRLAALSPAQRSLLERILADRWHDGRQIRRRPAGSGAPAGPDTGLPVSYEQERLWFMNELLARREIFHVPIALELVGRVDPAALGRSLGRLADRHEALRTVFADTTAGPRQIVLDHVGVPLDLHSHRDAADPAARARADASASVNLPFDLRTGPLLRCALHEIEPDRHLFLLTQHHIISDYWSLGILLEDLGALYASELGLGADLPPVDLHYPDFAYWQRETMGRAALDTHLDYWRDRLADAPETLDLPLDHARPPVRRSQGRFHRVQFAPPLLDRARDLARQNATTPLAVFLAGYAALLGRLTRAEDVVIGVPVAGRTQPETQRMVGYFLNWLAIRIRLDGRPSTRELIIRTRDALAEAMVHQDVPFDLLVHELQPARRRGGTPIFQTSFSLRDGAPEPPRLPGLQVGFADLDGGATHFDLMGELWCEQDRVVGYLPYDDELFDEDTVADYADRLGRLLTAGTAEPDRPVATLPLTAGGQSAGLVRVLEPAAVVGTLHDRFREQAAARPDAIAVTDEETRLSYAELDHRANRIARVLRDQGVRPGAIVGLVLDRTVDLVAAVLGVLGCGAAYLPVDPEAPADRAAAQFADCAVAAVLTTADLLDRLPQDPPPVLELDWAAAPLTEADETPPGVDVPASAPAYVIYTSGSTGAPKGVVVTHANVLRLFTSAGRLFELGPDEVWTLFHSYAFDFSVWELWGALLHGARLVVVPQWTTRAPDAFAELLEHEQVTMLSQTPSAFRQLARVVLSDPRPLCLRHVVFGGEALDHAALAKWVGVFGDEKPRLINMYGITETTVHVTFRRFVAQDLAQDRSLIGDPLPDLALYLLDPELQPVPAGVPGEIHVGGAGVALGYLGAPGLTAQRMLPDPFSTAPGARMYASGDLALRRRDGEFVYLGRADDQHKIRGHRVELGEIRAALLRLPEVADAAVLVAEDRFGAKALTAYVVRRPETEVTATRIRRGLLRTLPDWMVPASVVVVEALALTRNGKLDRHALAARGQAPGGHGQAVPPVGPQAEALARIWSELLGVPDIGAEDDFFELGGHSLMVVHLVGRIRAELGVDMPMEVLFQHAELQAMADTLAELRASAGSGAAQPQTDAGSTAVAAAPDADADLRAVTEEVAARLAHLPRAATRPRAATAPWNAVLLTGATGFVGAFVLAELLSQGDHVTCLVRGDQGRERVIGNLTGLKLWRPEYSGLLETVTGDLCEPRLGLASETYDALTGRIGRIMHCAAWVNHVYPYAPLAAANAHSAGKLLEFAATGARKHLTLVSTGSVLDAADHPRGAEIEAGPLTVLAPERAGYVRSKAVAELYLAHAADLGVPALVVRAPSVFGDRTEYQINPADAIWNWTKAIILTGRYPASFADPDNELFQALPADAAARAVLSAAEPADPDGCRYVNAIPNVVCGAAGLLAGVRAAGFEPAAEPDRDWYRRVGGLDSGEVWVAAIAAQIAAGPDPSAARRLHRFRTDDRRALAEPVDAQAISSPTDLAGYIGSLLASREPGNEGTAPQ
ncbi:MAG TPA: amino acid adenylation domain-containing protein [Actinocrinis sp.]|nr:amino acid adenylation domain-containing protein [Actinocrinis sp.]